MNDLIFSPTDFVAVFNQTLEFAYPFVTIEGEISNFRVSRNKWVYFDVKDETSSIKCFGTVYVLPGPLEDGMVVRLVAQPRLHPLYNFSLNLNSIVPIGEGSLKRAADLLFSKLEKEGLFDESRKRSLPFAPSHIGLITSKQSAAYADFIKILDVRWGGVQISHVDVQVQGEQAISDIVAATEKLNQLADAPQIIVITRGGGSLDDLAAFSSEQVTRAVATSRIPTLVAIGHEVDLSLAELAADQRASTPSNAAELLVPDKHDVLKSLDIQNKSLTEMLQNLIKDSLTTLKDHQKLLHDSISSAFVIAEHIWKRQTALLNALNPAAALTRGYAIVRVQGKIVKSIKQLKVGQNIELGMSDGQAQATIKAVQ